MPLEPQAMGEPTLDTTEFASIEEAMAALNRATVAVTQGRLAAATLYEGLGHALEECEGLARQLSDDTFASDDASRVWRAASTDAVEALQRGLTEMSGALEGEVVDNDALLGALERVTQAEKLMRIIYRGAQGYNASVREAMENASRIPCMRCGKRNPNVRTSCEQCHFPLPNTGVERVEIDLVGGPQERSVAESVFLRRLRELAALPDSERVRQSQEAIVFLEDLERLYLLGERQVDTLVARAPKGHPASVLASQLRTRIQHVKETLANVRSAVGAGDPSALLDLVGWLEEQFYVLQDLKEQIADACA